MSASDPRLRSLARQAAPCAVLLLVSVATTACPGFIPPPPSHEEDAGDAATDGGPELAASDATADQAVDAAPLTCNPSVDPTAAPCLVAGGGLFVSTTGSDSNDGSPAHPFATVGYALHAANPTGRVYLCGGPYTERVALQAGASANLYGGFACPTATSRAPDAGDSVLDAGADASDAALAASNASTASSWTPGGSATVFSPPTFDPLNNWALSVSGVTTPTRIQSIQFVAPTPSGTDASHNGNSSFAAVVIGSALTLVDVTLTAGRGVDGAPGTSGDSSPNYSGPKAPDGVAPFVDFANVTHLGAGGVQTACVYAHDNRGIPQSLDSSTGGNGGDSAATTLATAGSANPLPPVPAPAGSPPQDGLAGPNDSSSPNGHPGAYGQTRASGAAALTLGTLTATMASASWTPSPGGAGTTGGPGQGGGGGGGNDPMGSDSLGGGGGAGGCGGTGGSGGAGGGASVALLAVDNLSLSLTGCVLSTGGGGTGGAGGSGEAGQVPGLGAAGFGSSPVGGGLGGNGGNGAGGSGGAGGTGGVSAAILYRGSTPPTLQNCTLSVGDPGHGGAGGTPGGASSPWTGLVGATGFDEYQAYGASLASVKSVLELF